MCTAGSCRIVSGMRIVNHALAALLVLVGLATAPSEARAQLGIPIPQGVTAEDVLSTENGTGNAGGVVPGAGACDSAARRNLAFPADDAPHPDALEEWWFWTGRLKTSDGRRLAFMAYFLSRGASGPYLADAAISDLDTGSFRPSREPLVVGAPGSSVGGFALRAPQVTASGGDGRDRLRIAIAGETLTLRLRAIKPVADVFGGGSVNAYCNRAYYYARPRLAVRGHLASANGSRKRVRGAAFFDHAWGFFPALAVARWQYVQLRLEDGTDALLGRVEVGSGAAALNVGMVSDRHGRVRTLDPDDFELAPVAVWQRDATCSYPIAFRVTLDGHSYTVRAAINNAEFGATLSPLAQALWPETPSYWDGPAVVSGDQPGVGWIDLGRYCAA